MFDVRSDLLDLYKRHDFAPGPLYEASMTQALDARLSYGTPAMYGVTATVLSSRKMIAHNLVQNSIDEAKGAARIQIIADRYADGTDLYAAMRRHVAEELKHSKQFLDLVPLTGFTAEQLPADPADVDEVLDFDDDLRGFLCRVHSIEIRSWTVLRTYQAVLGERRFPEIADSALPVLDDIMGDEINHVVYTGRQLDAWLREDAGLQDVLDECFAHTNHETWQDIASMTRYLADNYATL
jgi:hypothetical protein